MGKNVCVCCDFNVVCRVEEGRVVGLILRSLDYVPFDSFIEDNFLVNLSLHKRKFTWFKGDDNSMS